MWARVVSVHVSLSLFFCYCDADSCCRIALRVFVSLSRKLLAEPKRANARVRRVFDDIVVPPLPLVRRFRGAKVSRKPLGRLGHLGFLG